MEAKGRKYCRAFCNTFDLHQAIIGPENQSLVFLRVTIFTQVFTNRAHPDQAVPWVCLQFVIVVFLVHTHLLFTVYAKHYEPTTTSA